MGWRKHALLVPAQDDDRLVFQRDAPLTAPPPPRLTFVGPLAGQGIVLDDKLEDGGSGHKNMHARLGNAEEAVFVELDKSGHLVVVGGHNRLGFALDDWENRKVAGTRCSFTDWHFLRNHVFTLNDDLTLSKEDNPALVLGWSKRQVDNANLCMVVRHSPERLVLLSEREAEDDRLFTKAIDALYTGRERRRSALHY